MGAWFPVGVLVTVTARVGAAPVATMPTELRTVSVAVTGPATVMGTGLLASAMLWLAAVYPAPTLLDDYLPYYLLLGFAEAWLNGAMVTLMVVYLPHWVGSFDDRRYILNK